MKPKHGLNEAFKTNLRTYQHQKNISHFTTSYILQKTSNHKKNDYKSLVTLGPDLPVSRYHFG